MSPSSLQIRPNTPQSGLWGLGGALSTLRYDVMLYTVRSTMPYYKIPYYILYYLTICPPPKKYMEAHGGPYTEDTSLIRDPYITRYHAIYYTTLQYTILYYTILYYTILYYTILYYTILYYTILYYTILYYTILYYTMLNYTILKSGFLSTP